MNETKKETKKTSKTKELELQLDSLKKELQQEKEKNLRLQAEFANYKQRSENDKSNMFKYEGSDIIKAMLEIVDDFERALNMDDSDLSDEVSNFLKGYKIIYTRLITCLDNLGVKELLVEGLEFNPETSEAILVEHDENKPEGVVLEVLKKAYMYKDRLLRSAMVKVNK